MDHIMSGPNEIGLVRQVGSFMNSLCFDLLAGCDCWEGGWQDCKFVGGAATTTT
jgi:hypothetical protein